MPRRPVSATAATSCRRTHNRQETRSPADHFLVPKTHCSGSLCSHRDADHGTRAHPPWTFSFQETRDGLRLPESVPYSTCPGGLTGLLIRSCCERFRGGFQENPGRETEERSAARVSVTRKVTGRATLRRDAMRRGVAVASRAA